MNLMNHEYLKKKKSVLKKRMNIIKCADYVFKNIVLKNGQYKVVKRVFKYFLFSSLFYEVHVHLSLSEIYFVLRITMFLKCFPCNTNKQYKLHTSREIKLYAQIICIISWKFSFKI